MIAMSYIILYLLTSNSLLSMKGGGTLKVVLIFGAIIIALFSVVIILYANSFLIKQRKRELGLYNILGMEKRHIAKVVSRELLYCAFVSIALGLGVGILFSKIVLLLLGAILDFNFGFGFEVSPIAIIITVIGFVLTYGIALVWDLAKVGVSKPIELLRGGEVGEREPKTKWPIAILGVLTLGAGYAMALTIKNPSAALGMFFIAVILVIIGTYCLFTAGSIAVLKLMRSNKRYYYKPKHFINVSGMLYRMRQNAVGLGNICILSTMILVMISSTVCLYYGMEDSLRNEYPNDVELFGSMSTQSYYEDVKSIVEEAIPMANCDISDYRCYRRLELTLGDDNGSLGNITEFMDVFGNSNECSVFIIPLEDYCDLQGVETSLKPNQVLAYSSDGSLDYDQVSIVGIKYDVKEVLTELNVEPYYNYLDIHAYYFVVADMDQLNVISDALSDRFYEYDTPRFSFYIGMNTDTEHEELLFNTISRTVTDYSSNSDVELASIYYRCIADARESYLGIYGGLFFLGICLGLVFMMAAVLIMYYKQISEGYSDRRRFEIMQQVGMTNSEVKGTIRSQVLTVFFLPLVAAGIHLMFAFPMLSRMFTVLSITNYNLFLVCTLVSFGVFAILYLIVYSLTARTYYKIVSSD